jgi:hypothetical protein
VTEPARASESEAPAPEAPEPEAPPGLSPETAPQTPRASQGETPLYKGEPLDAERGPGLGCFWIQIILLGFLLVLTPLTVLWAWPAEVSAVLLIVTLLLLLFAGQTVIFLLRLVAADRRSRRVPRSASARRTVGMIEDAASTSSEVAAPTHELSTDELHDPSSDAR